MRERLRAGIGSRSKAKKKRPTVRLSWHLPAVEGANKKAGPNVDIEVFSFMTTLPNALTRPSIMRGRRCCSPKRSSFDLAHGTPKEAFGLIRASDAECMRIVRSGFDKKDVLDAVRPLAAAEVL